MGSLLGIWVLGYFKLLTTADCYLPNASTEDPRPKTASDIFGNCSEIDISIKTNKRWQETICVWMDFR